MLSPAFERRLLAALGSDVDNPRRCADAVKRLSDFYLANPGQTTPWRESWAPLGYLSYFLPLNYLRLKAALREVKRFLPADSFAQVWDFGSGTGTTQWALEDEELPARPLFCAEISSEARKLHAELAAAAPTRWEAKFVGGKSGGLAIFSYAFLEMQNSLPELNAFDHLLIVEPSTRDCGRNLMEWRDRLMKDGFTPLAPCTHSLACPLLTQSPRDWCHNRVPVTAPDWWIEIENFLPMKNRTLTYSYLLVSRTVSDSKWRGAVRVIGDTLEERGKTKQMICRGEQREFLSWLHKHGEPPRIPHGALIRDLSGAEMKGSEIRPGPLQWTE